jgi:hypothetical protein
MGKWITLHCISSYPLTHSPYCCGTLPHQVRVIGQPAILPKCLWHIGGPAIGVGNGGGIANFAPLVVHFEEEEVGELLDVIAVGEAVVTQDGAVVPEALDNGGGGS